MKTICPGSEPGSWRFSIRRFSGCPGLTLGWAGLMPSEASLANRWAQEKSISAV